MKNTNIAFEEMIANRIQPATRGEGNAIRAYRFGSTLIACEQSGRHCRAIESDPLHCDLILRRWEQFTGEKAEKI